MDTVNEVIDSVGETFKGIFSGGAEMSTGKKVAVGVLVVGAIVIIGLLIWWIYNNYFAKFGTRRVGPAGCCGKLQNPRVQMVEAQLSNQDMMEDEDRRALAGMPSYRYNLPGSGMPDNLAPMGVMGFSSPAAKPSADDQGPGSEVFSNKPAVLPQAPFSRNYRPSYDESDFLNIAYSG